MIPARLPTSTNALVVISQTIAGGKYTYIKYKFHIH